MGYVSFREGIFARDAGIFTLNDEESYFPLLLGQLWIRLSVQRVI